jgi:hypothetical protein
MTLMVALALSGCEMTSGGREQPFAIATRGVIAVDVTGMEPQVAIVRRDATRLGWRITCEGSAGEERVLRLTFTTRYEEAVRSYFTSQNPIGSSARFYSSQNTPPAGCDQEPPTTSSSHPSSILALGPRELLAPLLDAARACGFTSSAIRQRRQEDVAQGTPRLQED